MSKTLQVLTWVMAEMVRGMTATETVDVSSTRGPSNTLLSGRWLAIARIVWVLVFVAILAAFFIQIPYYLAFMSRACPDTCGFTTQQEEALASIGISLDVFAWIALSCTLGISLISVVLALILFRRRSNDWMAQLVALFLVGYPIMNNGTTGNLPTDIPPSIWILLQVLTFPVWIIYAATFMLFPSGRFVPHWTWILFIFWGIWGS